MTDVAARVASAATFLWLGMVLAISLLEAPLRFRAPGVDIPTGLAIGRVVFRALNTVEVGWVGVIALALIVRTPSASATFAASVAIVVLIVQVVVVRPRLNRRSHAVLAGADAPRSRSHHAYIALEAVKVTAVAAGGVLLLSG